MLSRKRKLCGLRYGVMGRSRELKENFILKTRGLRIRRISSKKSQSFYQNVGNILELYYRIELVYSHGLD